jgi:hypothetical protein
MINPAYFVPDAAIIVNMTRGIQTVSTTSAPHGFQVGVYIRFDILGKKQGMKQLDGVIAPITAVTQNTFTVDIDSRNFDIFRPTQAFPLNSYRQLSQAVPVAEDALTLKYANKNNGTAKPYVYTQTIP